MQRGSLLTGAAHVKRLTNARRATCALTIKVVIIVDVSVISQLVQSVGFPIACVGALMYYISTQQEKMRATLEENTRAVLEMTITVKQHLCGGDENV